MKLEVGSGENPHEGYDHCDVRPGQPHQELVCPAWAIPVVDGLYQEVFSNHILEHLTQAQGEAALREWLRVLSPGGRMEVHLPDLEGHILQYNTPGQSPHHPELSNRTHAMAGFYGWQRFPEDSHQWGYSYETLAGLLMRLGYQRVARLPGQSYLMLDVEAYKP